MQTFGIEIECFLPVGVSRAEAARLITAAGVVCHAEEYNHYTRPVWKIVTDGSLGDYSRGAEIVSPVLSGPEGFEAARKVCTALTAMGATVNRRCGLHVHVGARNQSPDFFKNLFDLYHHFETAIDAVMPSSRRASNNTFCRSVAADVAHVKSADTVQALVRHFQRRYGAYARYFKINVQSYDRHGTVEFRQHSGTVDADKVINWTKLCLAMCEAAARQSVGGSTDAIRFAGWANTRKMFDLMLRPEGATEDLLRLVGRKQRLGLQSRAAKFGYTLRLQVINGERHWFATDNRAPVQGFALPSGKAMTDLLAMVGQSDLTAFFAARANRFSARA